MRIIAGVIVVLLATGLWVSCSGGPRVDPPAFDGDRAFGYLVDQVAFGPRVPGSQASAQCRDYFYRHFSELGLTVDSQAFDFFDPYSRTNMRMVNVMASANDCESARDRCVVLMAHYDCRPRADLSLNDSLAEQPIDGANDGASGVAVLMELANLFTQVSPPCAVDLVLVDGEDWGIAGDHDRYMLGSREFARRGIRGRYAFGIVVDMVGDADQTMLREGFSEVYFSSLNDVVWQIARERNISTFRDSVGDSVLDDHLSLNAAGVPSIDLIDIDYAYWHTEFDTPDKCSGQSLANVGRVLADLIYNPSLWPKK